MPNQELKDLQAQHNISPWRLRLAQFVESMLVQKWIVGLILLNSIVLGFETSPQLMEQWGTILLFIDKFCLFVFVLELVLKLMAYRSRFWRSGWSVFDFVVVSVALMPGGGTLSVLRSLRVLRVLRLLTAIPALRRVVAAFLHSIPGLTGVVAIMLIFFYTAGVLATKLFGSNFPDWFGSLPKSLYTLFQIMTLESWSMGIVRPVMEQFPLAWAFFVPFIVIATFTILNLFIGIIVSTMQELSMLPDVQKDAVDAKNVLKRIESDIQELKALLEEQK